jgi:hypothetical protein
LIVCVWIKYKRGVASSNTGNTDALRSLAPWRFRQ